MSAIVLTAGVTCADAGERHGVIGHTITFKAVSHESGNSAFLWETQSPPGAFVPPHIHTVEDEYIYVVEGEMEAMIGTQTYTARPGDLIKMPKNVPHALRSAGSTLAKSLWTVVPAGKMEGLFQALGALPTNEPPDPVKIGQIFAAHDLVLLPPPGA